ncbi:hypothetical protein PQQ51_33935 [Paraburkholderia xenovorans]|uniref:hypothetical protein n=1 Tax=Paraburkholderia xenovorans TaxID=36873 RepID=UPI0038B7E15B
MNTLTIKDGSGQTVSFKARVMPGTPPEMGTLYVLLQDDGTDNGKPNPKQVVLTDGSNKKFVFFDCIEVVNFKAFAFTFLDRKRLDEIGEFVSFP